ncbi:hypothetical protein VM1G_07855 [Cytospora mali]|uniref:Uncharacterized protein n=1 Tax=Cytospora mali TaxID=578113 RepID=A0A194W5S4_CYTMA|nr:hypothetical protein VM1G_07855 [Valsa mali]
MPTGNSFQRWFTKSMPGGSKQEERPEIEKSFHCDCGSTRCKSSTETKESIEGGRVIWRVKWHNCRNDEALEYLEGLQSAPVGGDGRHGESHGHGKSHYHHHKSHKHKSHHHKSHHKSHRHHSSRHGKGRQDAREGDEVSGGEGPQEDLYDEEDPGMEAETAGDSAQNLGMAVMAPHEAADIQQQHGSA